MYGELAHNRPLLEYYFRYYIGIPLEDCPDRVVVTPVEFEELGAGDFQTAVRALGWDLTVIERTEGARFGRSYITERAGVRILWSVGGIGASYAFGHATLLSLAGSVKAVVFNGSAGGIGKQVLSYDVNVPSWAVCGIWSKAGWEPSLQPVPTDTALSSLIMAELNPSMTLWDRRIHSGDHYTVAHYFMETISLLTRLEADGILTIDLEFSVYADVLGAAGIPVAGVLRASDLPLRGIGYHDSFERKDVTKAQAAGVKSGILTALLSVLQHDAY